MNTEDNKLITQNELTDALANMLESRVQDAVSIEEVTFCIRDCLEEWIGAYNIVIEGDV
jgi:hypothetical protein